VQHEGSVPRASRAGFTLIEILMVVVLIGIMTAIGFPRMRDGLVKSDVKSARSQAMLLYAQGRASAQESGRAVTLDFTANTALLTATPRLLAGAGTVDTIAGPINLVTEYKVTVAGSPSPTLTIDPRGFGSSAGTTITFTRAGVSDSIVVSDFGRIVD
jgi:prepilin-type N-terminal cleavage/methylation domain-containing protein